MQWACIICCSLGSIYGPTGFHYHSPRLQLWLSSHVSSLRLEKAPILAAFPNILRLPLLSKAFTSPSTLNTYFPLLHSIQAKDSREPSFSLPLCNIDIIGSQTFT